MSRLRVTWGFGRRKGAEYYYLRIVGYVPDPVRGARRLDTDEQVPDELFRRARVNAREKTARGDVIAANYAAKRERELSEDSTSLLSRHAPTIQSVAEHWLAGRERKDPKTIESDKHMIGLLVEYFGARDPSTIDIAAMEDCREWLLARDVIARQGVRALRKMSPRTAYNVLSFGRRLFAWGYARASKTGMTGLRLHASGAEGVPEVEGREGRGGARIVSVDEFWRAYDAAALRPKAGAKSQILLALAWATWLRAEALMHMRFDWIDLGARTVTVPREFVKGGRGDLTLPLNRFALSAIERARAIRGDSPYVLPPNPLTGEPATNLHHTLAAIAEDAKLRPFSLHGLRKGAATLTLNHRCERHPTGVPKIVADTILSHAMPRLDRAYYLVDLDTMRDALTIVDEAWDLRNRREDAVVVDIASRRW